jgi:hypothetical protein
VTEDKKVYDVRSTDSIAEAEKWQQEGFKVHCIMDGKILMRRKVEDSLFIERLRNDKAFREKVLEEAKEGSDRAEQI